MRAFHNKMTDSSDYLELPEEYRMFYDRAAAFIPLERLFCDLFRTLSYGTDASFYRLIPKIIVKATSPKEISKLLGLSNRYKIPVTFRAAGTSLSGQSVTDSVLIMISGGWKNYTVLDNGERITLEPGVIGADANRYLSPYKRKIGPDPASINHCMIGGIAANNASGMCCGTAQNSYRTVESIKVILSNGAMLDTGDPDSRRLFAESHRAIIAELKKMRDDINSSPELKQRIAEKYKIKNTMGYSINAFVDYTDPIDILLHLMIGSEGTLGFISEITYKTVIEHTHKATALVIFPDIEDACKATIILKKQPVSAVELMDRASLRSVELKQGMPVYLKGLPDRTAALLVETRAEDNETLLKQMESITLSLRPVSTIYPVSFTDNARELETLWNVRKGLFTAVGGTREIGTTVVIEDVVFPIEKLATATLELEKLMKEHGYAEGIIFGHALEGNLHFVFTQDFSLPDEVMRYKRFMDDINEMVVKKYDGSLKGEHGTGRNMAPFVEMEWGHSAYEVMKRIKKIFDPEYLLNRGVMINDNPSLHLENLKPMPKVHKIIDKCIECGFCEMICPSKNLTMTPRQRIVIQREISYLRATTENRERFKRLIGDYNYLGEQTCAADGLCSTTCPITINTGDFTKHLRSQRNSRRAVKFARWASRHYSTVLSTVRLGLKATNLVHSVAGTSFMSSITKGIRLLSGKRIPLWNPYMPKGISARRFKDVIRDSQLKVVYFPSCIVRVMGPARGDKDQRPVFEAMLSILEKAGCHVLFPDNIDKLCCGVTFESKGFLEQADRKCKELETELLASSNNGKYPIICDTSPCLYRIRRAFKSHLQIYDPAEFIQESLMDRLRFQKIPQAVALHVTCGSIKAGLHEKLKALAQACAERVVIPDNVNCCGFAGDKGFYYPELNESVLSSLRSSLPSDCHDGYSNSRTCEIGLSLHSGINYQSIIHLVDRCTTGKD